MAKRYIDPTRTALIRRRFEKEMRRRFNIIKRAIKEAVVEKDVFGIKESSPDTVKVLFNVEAEAFRFLTDAKKVEAFRDWLQNEIDQNLLTAVGGIEGQPWTAEYVESAYRKGRLRAFFDVRKKDYPPGTPEYAAAEAEYMRAAFFPGEMMSKIALVSTRAFEQLRGITGTMSQQISRVLADGLAHGWDVDQITREMTKIVGDITRKRAMLIARTEVIHAHAEGQLDGLEQLGIYKVTVQVEILTAGDERVCVECAELEGEILSIDEARGIIPLHPNCRCAWQPIIE